jgi:23S rRNA pseudouridine955/2504/2580 synthase
MKTLVVNKNDGGQRLDKFLSKKFKSLPMSLMNKYIRKKDIKINGKRAENSTMLSEGDVITLYIPEEFFGSSPKADSFKSLNPDLKIVYEDENILIVDKPAGLICHSDDKEMHNTLIDNIKAYLYQKGEYDSNLENSFAPSLCNRIDRNTCGLVIAAKNAETLRVVNYLIKEKKIRKTYLAVVHGRFTEKSGVYRSYMKKDQSRNIVFSKKERLDSSYKEAITEYNVVDYFDGLSLVEINLITGRTHQIRVHFSDNGHPLLGDGKYSVNKTDREKGFKFQALCAYKLKFTVPKEENISYLNGREFKAEKPEFLKMFM